MLSCSDIQSVSDLIRIVRTLVLSAPLSCPGTQSVPVSSVSGRQDTLSAPGSDPLRRLDSLRES